MDGKDGFVWLLLASVTGVVAVSCSAMVYVVTDAFSGVQGDLTRLFRNGCLGSFGGLIVMQS